MKTGRGKQGYGLLGALLGSMGLLGGFLGRRQRSEVAEHASGGGDGVEVIVVDEEELGIDAEDPDRRRVQERLAREKAYHDKAVINRTVSRFEPLGRARGKYPVSPAAVVMAARMPAREVVVGKRAARRNRHRV